MIVSEFRSSLPQVVAVSIKNIILIGEFNDKVIKIVNQWCFFSPAFGMTLGFPTVLIPALQEHRNNENGDEFALSKSEISWISSINLICVPMGCVFSGTFTSILGRKRAMQLVCLPILAAWITFFLSHQVFHLYIALCLSGFAGKMRTFWNNVTLVVKFEVWRDERLSHVPITMMIDCYELLISLEGRNQVLWKKLRRKFNSFSGGMLEAPVLTYVAEISTPKLRGILAATGSFCIILGIFSQFLMGLFIDWRTITLLSTLAPILAILLLFFVPESPHWLILKKRDEEAKKSLMWLRGWHKTFDGVKPEFDELHKNLTKRDTVANHETEESLLKAFSKRTFILPYFICSLAFLIGHFSGMTTLQTYAVYIFAQLKAPVDKYFATMLLGIVELIGTALCVMLVRFVGKRKLTFVSLFGCSFCFFSTAIYAIFIDKISGEIPTNTANTSLQIVDTENSSMLLQIESSTFATTITEMTTLREYVNSLQDASISVNETTAWTFENLQPNELSWIPLTLLLASALLSHSGIRLLPWMLIGEVFPTKIRGISSGLTGFWDTFAPINQTRY